MEAVTDVLVHRMRTPGGLNRMLVASLAAHAGLAVLLLFLPSGAFRDETPRTVMTISDLKAKPAPKTPVRQAPPDARSTIPARAPELAPGSTIAETGARGVG